MSDIRMSKQAFTKEHEELTKTLKSGNKAALRKEYKEQSAELKGIKGAISKRLK